MLIGIAGAKRSGKDTLARGLSKLLDLPVDSFAAPLRKFVADLLNVSVATLEECKEHPIKWLDGKTPRQMMQTVGTEWGRDTVHADLWLRSLLHRLTRRGAIISDVRFPNEAEAILAKGGLVIELSRNGTGAGDSHVSEKPLPAELVTFKLPNNGTIPELVDAAVHAMEMRGFIQSGTLTSGPVDDLLAAECRMPPPNCDGMGVYEQLVRN
jgi:hypothetical protein